MVVEGFVVGFAFRFNIRPLHIARPRIAVRIDFAAIIGAPLFRIAQNFISNREVLEAPALVGRTFWRIRMEAFRECTKGALDLIFGRGPRESKN